MSVEVVVLVAGVVFGCALLAAVAWGLTRAKDRLQLATACLFLCVLGYGAAASGAMTLQGSARMISLSCGVYAVLLYGVTAFLAVRHSRWAWRASIASLGIHIALTLVGSPVLIQAGKTGLAALVFGLLVGGLGLWACLHKGSRELVSASSA